MANDSALARNIVALAGKWGYRDGRNDPQGIKGPSRAHARMILDDCYDDGSVFDAYAKAYREGSDAAATLSEGAR